MSDMVAAQVPVQAAMDQPTGREKKQVTSRGCLFRMVAAQVPVQAAMQSATQQLVEQVVLKTLDATHRRMWDTCPLQELTGVTFGARTR